MKLSELNPKWLQPYNWVGSKNFYMGMTLLCPHCADHGRVQRFAVEFWPPVDPENYVEKFQWKKWHDKMWERISGTSFSNITLAPKVQLTDHFWGAVINGELEIGAMFP